MLIQTAFSYEREFDFQHEENKMILKMYCIQRAKYMNIEYDQKLKGKIHEDRI